MRPTRTTARSHAWRRLPDACRPYMVLLPVGFAVPRPLPAARCALTAPFHPYRKPEGTGGLLSVALSLGSPPPGVTRHRVTVEPGLSSMRVRKPEPRSSGRLVPGGAGKGGPGRGQAANAGPNGRKATSKLVQQGVSAISTVKSGAETGETDPDQPSAATIRREIRRLVSSEAGFSSASGSKCRRKARKAASGSRKS